MDYSPRLLAQAGQILRAEGVVAFPTETVYGLGALGHSDRGCARIFEIKGRPQFNPLILHGVDQATLMPYVEWTPLAQKLADAFWPGPLTLVLKRRSDGPQLSDLVCAGLKTLAIRVPAHPVARALLAEVNCPIAAPSANSSGRLSPTHEDHVAADLGARVDLILPGGDSPIGLESTIVNACSETPEILRLGGLSVETISPLPMTLKQSADQGISCPGQLLSHYAPRVPLILYASRVESDQGLLTFGHQGFDGTPLALRNLSPDGDLQEAAHNLFKYLHELERVPGIRSIAVSPIPEHGLGLAIMDRLSRGAHH